MACVTDASAADIGAPVVVAAPGVSCATVKDGIPIIRSAASTSGVNINCAFSIANTSFVSVIELPIHSAQMITALRNVIRIFFTAGYDAIIRTRHDGVAEFSPIGKNRQVGILKRQTPITVK
jgi:hypothetical protein